MGEQYILSRTFSLAHLCHHRFLCKTMFRESCGPCWWFLQTKLQRERNPGSVESIVDHKLEGKYPQEMYTKLVDLALMCASFEKNTRPSMKVTPQTQHQMSNDMFYVCVYIHFEELDLTSGLLCVQYVVSVLEPLLQTAERPPQNYSLQPWPSSHATRRGSPSSSHPSTMGGSDESFRIGVEYTRIEMPTIILPR